MFGKFLGLKKAPDAAEGTDGGQPPAAPLDPAQDRLQRLASRGQSQAAKEKFAKAPRIVLPAARPAPAEPASEAPQTDVEPAVPNEVHELQERLEADLGETAFSPDLVPAAPHPAIAAAQRQAIMFRQHLPPQPDSLSYWGGTPRLPVDFVWPTFTTSSGEIRALTFLGQFDLAAIPADAGLGLLPRTGILAFFLDLHWGAYWNWRVVHVDADPATLVEHDPPATLPPAYADRSAWGWPMRDADWPRLLPRWSVDPVVVRAPDEAHAETPYWPGAIDRATATAAIAELEAGLPEHDLYAPGRDARGALEQPFGAFPFDWRSVAIALGHLDAALPDLPKRAAKALAADLADWRRKLERAEAARRPLSPTARTEAWRMLKRHDKAVEPLLPAIVVDAIEAALAVGEPDTLPPEAVAYVTDRHRFSAGDERMLCAPTFVAMEAEDRAPEWLCLLELGANPGLGHHFAEGVYQFWIRPEDLALGNFDAVELSAETY